ncbi:MAG: hypothetical protein CFE22_01255 [Cytophagaceae bacterium BCCC1]|nr:MAG: hypothetical protein CFE22_01255 [Cytophagaceae bacterium BCCC1]
MISKAKLVLLTLIYLLGGSIFLHLFYLKDWNHSIFEIAFNFGDVVENIINHNKFEGKYADNIDIDFRAHRLPAIPYLIAYLSKIFCTQKILFVALLKNLIFSLLWIPFLHEGINKRSIKPIYKVIIAGFLLSFPQLFLHGLQIDLEEAYIIPILAYYWFLVIHDKPFTKWQQAYFIVLPSLLFFSKNTFLYIIPILSVIIFITDRKKTKLIIASLLLLVISAYSLASFNQKNSGRFTLKYSLEWFNIYKGNNERTAAIYPKYSLDILDFEDYYKIPDSVKTEWEFNEFFKEKTITYFENHQKEILELLPTKILTIWFDIRPNGIFPGFEKTLITPLKILGMTYMLIFRILQWFCLIYLFLMLLGRNRKYHVSLSLKYISLIGLYFIPYTIAFGFERHLLPVIIPTLLTLLKIIEDKQALKI